MASADRIRNDATVPGTRPLTLMLTGWSATDFTGATSILMAPPPADAPLHPASQAAIARIVRLL